MCLRRFWAQIGWQFRLDAGILAMKNDLSLQAIEALRSYVARTQATIDSLREESYEKALRVLRLRKAAWHNFVAAFEMAPESLGDAEVLRGILAADAAQASQLDAVLAKVLIRSESQLTKEKQRIHRERSRIRRFKNDPGTGNVGFECTV